MKIDFLLFFLGKDGTQTHMISFPLMGVDDTRSDGLFLWPLLLRGGYSASLFFP